MPLSRLELLPDLVGPADRFPLSERATAADLASLAIYVGIFAGLTLTPMIVLRSSLASALLVYGGIAAAVAVLFLPLARERPAG